ncbi:MAG: hypothetical protein D4R76_00570 [Methylococcus sp.]|nr:MAG: hypothetical protein D4R76_00570 [Methylococcus sp.]
MFHEGGQSITINKTGSTRIAAEPGKKINKIRENLPSLLWGSASTDGQVLKRSTISGRIRLTPSLSGSRSTILGVCCLFET